MSLTPAERELFQNLRESLARVQERQDNLIRRVDGHGNILFGTHGNGGLNNDVHTLMGTVSSHIQQEGDVLDRQAILLVGERGDGGLVADMKEVKSEQQRNRDTRKLVTGIIWALAVEAVAALLAWIFTKF